MKSLLWGALSLGAFAGLAGCSEATDGDADGAGGTGGAGATGAAVQGSQAPSASGTTPSSSATGSLPRGCVDYSTFTPTAVGFASDVMPIFLARCQQCHDDPTASTYYGADAATVHQKLLQGVPIQAPHLRFVVPGDPLRSYMMAKVEYANPGGTCPLVACSEPGCELSAPPGNPLPSGELAVLRSWVLNGAAND